MTAVRDRSVEILLVEDSPDDIDLMLEALKEGRRRNHVSIAEDGVEALTFLRRAGKHAKAPRPDLILLDLNLPGKSGHEVLAEIKADANLRRIPVVILTSSASEQDIVKSYNLSANCYITKPVDLEELLSLVRAIDAFWVDVVALPPS
jgi:chemotaxis family two-component system response regulator Rcp1